MERCPICRARLNDGPHCPRCGADLTLPDAAERRAEEALRAGIAALAAGRREEAQGLFARAQGLKRGPLAGWLARWVGEGGHGREGG